MKGIALSLLLLLSAFAIAFDDFDVHCANIAILQDKRVQKEVGITAKQHDQLTKFAEAHTARLKAYQATLRGKQPDMNVLQTYMHDLTGNVVKSLTSAQLKRLRELNLQAAGLLGLLDKVVATKVGLNDAQFAKLQRTYSDGKNAAEAVARSAMLPIDQKYQSLAKPYQGHEKEHSKELQKLSQDYMVEAKAVQQKAQPRIAAITKDTEQKMIAQLSPQQKATWTALQGKRFLPPKQ